MPDNPGKTGTRRVLTWLGSLLIFFCFPLGFSSYVLHRSWEAKEREWEEQAFSKLDRLLLEVRRFDRTASLTVAVIFD